MQHIKQDADSVTLRVTGLGHIPAIKNSMYAIVEPKNREWKKRCVQLLSSQLLSSIATTEHGTVTPQCLRSLIALLPRDDSWKDIPEIHIYAKKVPKGEEGAVIEITRLP